MLFDPGPLTLIRDVEFPVPGPRPQFVTLAARALEELAGADVALGGEALTVVSMGSSELEAGGALDLARAVAELDSQSRDPVDSGAAAVAAQTATLEGVLAGLTGELPSANYGIPQAPGGPPEAGESERPPGGGSDPETGRPGPDRPPTGPQPGGGGGGGGTGSAPGGGGAPGEPDGGTPQI